MSKIKIIIALFLLFAIDNGYCEKSPNLSGKDAPTYSHDDTKNSAVNKDAVLEKANTAVEIGGGNVFLLDNNGGLWARNMVSASLAGELGLGDKEFYKEFKRVDIDARAAQISTTTGTTIMLDVNGEIWIAGRDYFAKTQSQELHNFTKVPLKTKALVVAAGWSYELFLDESGDIWVAGCGDGRGNQYVVKAKNEIHFKKIASEKREYRSAAIDANGSLWVADMLNARFRGCPVTFKEVKTDIKFQEIYAGAWSGFALIDKEGNLWDYGYSSSIFGTTGLVKVDGLNDIVAASVGAGYMLALDKNGNLWSAGLNRYGRQSDKKSAEFRRININTKFKTISAGFFDSFAIDSGGNIWSTKADDIKSGTKEFAPYIEKAVHNRPL